MLHKLPKYLVWIGAFLFVAMFPVGELCAQNNLETLTNKDLFAYPPKSSLRATRWLHKADKFKAEGNVEKAVLYYTKAAEKGDARAQFVLSLCYNEGYGVSPDAERSMHWLSLSVKQEYALAQNFLGVVYTYHKENADYKKGRPGRGHALDKKGGRAGICFGLGRHVAGLLFRCERFAS